MGLCRNCLHFVIYIFTIGSSVFSRCKITQPPSCLQYLKMSIFNRSDPICVCHTPDRDNKILLIFRNMSLHNSIKRGIFHIKSFGNSLVCHLVIYDIDTLCEARILAASLNPTEIGET